MPGNDGNDPTGFIPSVQFNGPWRRLYGAQVSAAQLVPDGGAPIELTVEDLDSGHGAYLDAGFDMIPRQPLAEGTWYTARAEGTVEASAAEPEEVSVPFAVSWRFRTKIVPRQAGLRIGVAHGLTRVISQSPAPVVLSVRDGRGSRQVSLSLTPNAEGRYEAQVRTELRTATWHICASQAADPSTVWLADEACAEGGPIDLLLTVLYAGSDFLRVRIKAPSPTWGRKATVSLLAKNGASLDRRRIALAEKSKFDLRGARGLRAKLRVTVSPFSKRGIPQRVRTIVRRVR